jgi:hypothetical protein
MISVCRFMHSWHIFMPPAKYSASFPVPLRGQKFQGLVHVSHQNWRYLFKRFLVGKRKFLKLRCKEWRKVAVLVAVYIIVYMNSRIHVHNTDGRIVILTLFVRVYSTSRLVLKALCYKPGGRGFETRWADFLNLPNPSGRTRPWGLFGL